MLIKFSDTLCVNRIQFVSYAESCVWIECQFHSDISYAVVSIISIEEHDELVMRWTMNRESPEIENMKDDLIQFHLILK